MPATVYMQNTFLKRHFGGDTGVSTSAPTTMYFGLSKSATAASGYEPTIGSLGYTRKTYTNSGGWTDPGATGYSTSNTGVINFGPSSGDWTTQNTPILSVFIADAASGGNILWYWGLAVSLFVPIYTTVTFSIDTVTVTV